jgi:hypothetical protein
MLKDMPKSSNNKTKNLKKNSTKPAKGKDTRSKAKKPKQDCHEGKRKGTSNANGSRKRVRQRK